MTDAQLQDWIDACTKMEGWIKGAAKARRGWKESREEVLVEIERRSRKKSD